MRKGLVALFAFTLFLSVPFSAFAAPGDPSTQTPSTETTPKPGDPVPAGSEASKSLEYTDCIKTNGLPVWGQGVAVICLFEKVAGFEGPTTSAVNSSLGKCLIDDIVGCLINTIAYLILQFANLLLALAGTLFNWVIVKTVFGFSTFLGNSPGLLIAWGILRDVGNMLLLFGFIFIGITMILDLHSYPAKKTLPRLIIFAILMNFSLFAAEAVIDTSNVLSSVMYTQANTDSCDYDEAAQTVGSQAGVDNLTSDENCFLNKGIAGKIMEVTGVSGIFDTSNGENTYSNAVVLLMLALFATVATVVLFAGAIMLIIRAVTLVFLMVLAPIGFAALAIPPLEKSGKEWWNRLIHQSFFAPIYLLLIFISLKIGAAVTGGSTATLANAIAQPHSSVMGIILAFSLVIGFLIASLIMAKKFGAMGASFAINTATGLTTRVMGGAVLGGAGFVGRQTLGRGSDKVARMVEGSDWAQKRPNLARMAVKPFDSVKAASFDARMTKAVQSGAKAIGSGADFGKPGKGAQKGYRGTIDEKVKARDEFEKRLKPTDEQKGVGEELEKELEDLRTKERGHLASELEEVEKQRLKVAQARLGNDKAALEAERTRLREKIAEYNDAKADPSNPFNEVIGTASDGTPILKGYALEKEAKDWVKRGNQEKTRVFVDEGLQNRWYNNLPLTPSALANEEARGKIRKDRSMDDLAKALKNIAAGASTAPVTPPSGTP